jgi:hypothetical protein
VDSQERASFENIEFLSVYTFGNILQKPWLPLTAGVIRTERQLYWRATWGSLKLWL